MIKHSCSNSTDIYSNILVAIVLIFTARRVAVVVVVVCCLCLLQFSCLNFFVSRVGYILDPFLPEKAENDTLFYRN